MYVCKFNVYKHMYVNLTFYNAQCTIPRESHEIEQYINKIVFFLQVIPYINEYLFRKIIEAIRRAKLSESSRLPAR